MKRLAWVAGVTALAVVALLPTAVDAGGGNSDAAHEKAGTIENMFDFSRHPNARHLFLDPATGQPIQEDDNP